jgi:hypothetical protein
MVERKYDPSPKLPFSPNKVGFKPFHNRTILKSFSKNGFYKSPKINTLGIVKR